MIFHFLFARRHREPDFYTVLRSFTDRGHVACLAKYNELTGNTDIGHKFREEHSDLIFGTMQGLPPTVQSHHIHSFEDPSNKNAVAQQKARIEAQSVAANLKSAETQLDVARKNLAVAKEAQKNLTPEQKQHLAISSPGSPAAQRPPSGADRAAASKRVLNESRKFTDAD